MRRHFAGMRAVTSRMRAVRRRAIGAVGLVVLALACREAIVEPVAVAQVVVTGNAAGLRLGQSAQLTTTLKSTEGWTLPNQGVTWSIGDASIATVTASGQVTAVKRGTVTVTASAGGVSGTASVTVIGVSGVAIAPDTLAVIVAEQQAVTANVTADPGVSVPPSWVARDTSVAQVDASGRISARKLGVTWVVASAEVASDSVKVRVVPVPVLPPASGAAGPVTTSVLSGAVSLTIPPGATTAPALTVAPVPTAPADDRIPAGGAYVFGPDGTQFATPITVSLRYDPAQIPAAKRKLLRLHLVDGSTVTEVAGGSVDSATNRVSAPVSHFSTYAILVPADPSQVAVSAGAGQTTFVNYELPVQPAVLVKDAQGRPVARAKVSFDITGGGGSLRSGAAASSDTALTGTDGVATLSAKWKLGQTAGTNTLTVKVFTAAGAVAVTTPLTATAQANPVARVVVSPDTATISVGSTRQLTAMLYDARDTVLTNRTVTWTSSDATKAIVSSTGLVTAVAPGTVTITATSEGKSATARLVMVRPVASISISPAALTLVIGETQQLSATVKDADGVTLSDRMVVWASADTTRATVSTTGLVAARREGPVIITATVDGVQGSAGITVLVPVASVELTQPFSTVKVGMLTQLTATAKDADGRVLTGRTVAWSSSDPTRATVDASGLVTPRSPGAVTITATITGRSASTGLTVGAFTGIKVERVHPGYTRLNQDNLTLQAGVYVATMQYLLLPGSGSSWASGGNVLELFCGNGSTISAVDYVETPNAVRAAFSIPEPVTCTFAASFITVPLTVFVDIAVTSVTGGPNLLRNGSFGDGSTAWYTGGRVTQLTAPPVWVSTVTLAPSAITLAPTDQQQFLAVLKDSSGNTLTDRLIGWQSSDITVATVSATGLVTATPYTGTATRSATITATSEGKSGTASVSVTPNAVITIDAGPSAIIPAIGATRQLTAVVRDGSGNVLNGQVVTWTSSDQSKVTVSSAGIVTALAAGTTSIIAASGGRTDTVAVTVVTLGTEPTRQTIAVGYRHACALTSDGTAYCWGGGVAYGSNPIGNGTATSSAVPTPVIGGLKFVSIHIGPARSFTCGLTAAGEVYCWGSNTDGQLGNGTFDASTAPVRAAPGLTFREISTDHRSVCGLQEGGAIYCWGFNIFGQLGDGTTTTRTTPVRATGIPDPIRIFSGIYGTCAMSRARQVYCWGQLYESSSGTRVIYSTPTLIAGGTAFAEFSMGVYTVCGRRLDGVTMCWGQNGRGELGDGTTIDRSEPTPVVGDPAFVTSTGGAEFYRCELNIAGQPLCWGRGYLEWNGVGSNTLIPTSFSTSPSFSRLAVYGFGCGLDATGRAFCWGPNDQGNLGDGTTTFRATPTAVSTALRFATSPIVASGSSVTGFRSCKDVIALQPLAVSGVYQIAPDGTAGNQTTAFCDMTTDGGGWTKVLGHMVGDNVARAVTEGSVTTGLRLAALDSGAVSTSSLSTLRTQIGFSEIRFVCQKASVGRRLHLKTSASAVVDFLTGRTNVQPDAPGSFARLADDASVLAAQPSQWGKAGGQYRAGKWGEENMLLGNRLTEFPMFIVTTAHWGISGGRSECDDYAGTSPNGEWSVFVR